MLFMARAAREGLQVSKPYGDSASYDFIVECRARCPRVQVKSTVAPVRMVSAATPVRLRTSDMAPKRTTSLRCT